MTLEKMRAERGLPGFQGMGKRVDNLAEKMGIEHGRMRLLVGSAFIVSSLPEGTVVKGGNSLSLSFPLKQTRFSEDLDAVVTREYGEWEKEFTQRLSIPRDCFQGMVRVRGGQEFLESDNMSEGEVLIPRNISVTYLGKPFVTVPMDITLSSDMSLGRSRGLSGDMRTIVESLGFNVEEWVTDFDLLSIEKQCAEKCGALFYNNSVRSNDVKDLGDVILPEMYKHGDWERFGEFFLDDLAAHEVQEPYTIKHMPELENKYVADGAGSKEKFRQTIGTLENIVSSIRRPDGTKVQIKSVLDVFE